MLNITLNHKHYQNQAYTQLPQALLPIIPMALGFTLHITIVLSIYKICIKKQSTIIEKPQKLERNPNGWMGLLMQRGFESWRGFKLKKKRNINEGQSLNIPLLVSTSLTNFHQGQLSCCFYYLPMVYFLPILFS